MSGDELRRAAISGELGFAGLTAAGLTAAEAWQILRDDIASQPAMRDLFRRMAGEPIGRAALVLSRDAWARSGLRPPWAELLEAGTYEDL